MSGNQQLGEVSGSSLVAGVGVHGHPLHPHKRTPLLTTRRVGHGRDAEVNVGFFVVANRPGAVEDHGQGTFFEGTVSHAVVHPLGNQAVAVAQVLDEAHCTVARVAPQAGLAGIYPLGGTAKHRGSVSCKPTIVEVGIAQIVEEAEGIALGVVLGNLEKLIPGFGGFPDQFFVVDQGYRLGKHGQRKELVAEGEGVYCHIREALHVAAGSVLTHGLQHARCGHGTYPVVRDAYHQIGSLTLGRPQDELILDIAKRHFDNIHLGSAAPGKAGSGLLEPGQLGATIVRPDGEPALGHRRAHQTKGSYGCNQETFFHVLLLVSSHTLDR